jgi:hypothetical protein
MFATLPPVREVYPGVLAGVKRASCRGPAGATIAASAACLKCRRRRGFFLTTRRRFPDGDPILDAAYCPTGRERPGIGGRWVDTSRAPATAPAPGMGRPETARRTYHGREGQRKGDFPAEAALGHTGGGRVLSVEATPLAGVCGAAITRARKGPADVLELRSLSEPRFPTSVARS